MAEPKTKPTPVSVGEFLARVENPERRADGEAVRAMMARITGEDAQMWGPSIIGFGSYDYLYDSGHGGTACRLGFSPRRAELVLYVLTESEDQAGLLARLGKHKVGKSCLYIKRLSDVDQGVLEGLTRSAFDHMNRKYPPGSAKGNGG